MTKEQLIKEMQSDKIHIKKVCSMLSKIAVDDADEYKMTVISEAIKYLTVIDETITKRNLGHDEIKKDFIQTLRRIDKQSFGIIHNICNTKLCELLDIKD